MANAPIKIIPETLPGAGENLTQAFRSIEVALRNAGTPGATGAPGQGFNFRGAWAASTAYAAYDVVTYGGSTWEAGAAIAPAGSFNPASWNLWASASGPGTPELAVTSFSANYTALGTDCVVIGNGSSSLTLTLPLAATYPGKLYIVKSYIAGATIGVSVAPSGSDTVEKAAGPYGPVVQNSFGYGWAEFISDGVSNWILVTTN